jgi:hypothetical protein
MKEDELIGAVLDYLEFRNQFDSDEYWGMASSQRPTLFYNYFDSLDESARKDLAHIMVAAAIGEVAELRTYMLIILHLISGLCRRGRCDYFVSESEV